MRDIDTIISKLTLRQKARLCQGLDAWNTYPVDKLGIPKIMMTDGPHGLRKQFNEKSAILASSVPATCFPTASATACSFDRNLLYDVGRAIGEEARDQDVSLVLGPGINIKRSPLCGRNFEYFSEDPLLSGEMGAAMVLGIQSTGAGACVKHFAANNREYFRMVANSIIDDRALNEIYLSGFKTVIEKAGPFAVMSSYNRMNSNYCGEDRGLLQGILREEMGFSGIVVSDWGAANDRVESIDAGMDLEMPYSGTENTDKIVLAVKNGKLDESRLDDCVHHLLEFVLKCEHNKSLPYNCDFNKHHELARRAAAESAVLLKNGDGILPLSPKQKIALIGGFVQKPRYQGAGSSVINPIHLENISEQFIRYGMDFEYEPGYDFKNLSPDEALIGQAVSTAEELGVAVIFAGLPSVWEIEGIDREGLSMPESHNELIKRVSEVAKTVVVLMGGGPVEMPWLQNVDAVLQFHLGGQAVASAIAEILRGIKNPSGRLAETYPLSISDTPSYNFFSDDNYNAEYRESIYVGYRYFDAIDRDVLFPFGYGLSYTTFSYSGFDIKKDINNAGVNIRFSIKNTGGRKGAEIPQVYLMSITCKDKKLVAFEKVFLKPGEEKTVEFT